MKQSHPQLFLYTVMVMSMFVWIGFVCAISFMEAWLKFQAPDVTIPIGLGIGKLVFGALNKVEWVLALVVSGIPFIAKQVLIRKFSKFMLFYIPVTILILQTFWLMPILNHRADQMIQGMKILPSYAHFFYVLLECIKVISLFFLGIKVIRSMN